MICIKYFTHFPLFQHVWLFTRSCNTMCHLHMMKSHKHKTYICLTLKFRADFLVFQPHSDAWNRRLSVGGWSRGLTVPVYSGLGVVKWQGFGLAVDWDRLGKQPKPRGAHDSDRPQAQPRIARSVCLSGCACIPVASILANNQNVTSIIKKKSQAVVEKCFLEKIMCNVC